MAKALDSDKWFWKKVFDSGNNFAKAFDKGKYFTKVFGKHFGKAFVSSKGCNQNESSVWKNPHMSVNLNTAKSICVVILK